MNSDITERQNADINSIYSHKEVLFLDKYSIQDKSIFLHSSFRTGSTWVWNKLRSSNNTIAYYEIFHEAIGSFKKDHIPPLDYKSWHSGHSGHPSMAPYFLEYFKLLGSDGGVIGHNNQMAFDLFMPQDGINGRLRVRLRRIPKTALA